MENEKEEFEQNGEIEKDEPGSFLSWKDLLQWQYIRWPVATFLAMILLFFLFDKALMPLYTKHGQEIKIPDVTGLSYEEAQKILQDHGFRPILDHKANSTSVETGHIISQSPVPGSIVKSNRRTYLTVSKGEKWVRVPKLVGGSERDAVLQLRQLDLVPGKRMYEFSSFYPKGVVSAQSVPVGDSLSVGDTVDIQISLGDIPENLTVPNLIGKSFEEAKKILSASGFQIGLITYQLNNDLLPETVIRQSLPADNTVDVGASIDLVLSRIEEKNEE